MEPLTPTGSSPTTPGPSGGGLGAKWPAQVADGIDSVVGLVRDKTVQPATLVAKALVYGPIAAIIGLLVVVMVAVAAVRGLNEIPGLQDWISLAAVGGLFTLVGLFLLRRGRAAGRSGSKR